MQRWMAGQSPEFWTGGQRKFAGQRNFHGVALEPQAGHLATSPRFAVNLRHRGYAAILCKPAHIGGAMPKQVQW